MKELIVAAKDLRKDTEIKKIPEGIGYYKWFASIDDLKMILNKLELSFDSIPSDQWEIENGLYCIYLGIARKSLRERLDWHVNNHHTLKFVSSGYLSSLRQSLSSILFSDQSKEKETNDFIDRLLIHYYYFENLNPESKTDRKTIENLETELINEHLHILNDKKNKNEFRTSTKLREIKKLGKITALRKLESN